MAERLHACNAFEAVACKSSGQDFQLQTPLLPTNEQAVWLRAVVDEADYKDCLNTKQARKGTLGQPLSPRDRPVAVSLLNSLATHTREGYSCPADGPSIQKGSKITGRRSLSGCTLPVRGVGSSMLYLLQTSASSLTYLASLLGFSVVGQLRGNAPLRETKARVHHPIGIRRVTPCKTLASLPYQCL